MYQRYEPDMMVVLARRLKEELKVENTLPDRIMDMLCRLLEAELVRNSSPPKPKPQT